MALVRSAMVRVACVPLWIKALLLRFALSDVMASSVSDRSWLLFTVRSLILKSVVLPCSVLASVSLVVSLVNVKASLLRIWDFADVRSVMAKVAFVPLWIRALLLKFAFADVSASVSSLKSCALFSSSVSIFRVAVLPCRILASVSLVV